jgi:hypothetical protein
LRAIRELLDRGYCRATQFVAAEEDAISGAKTAAELRAKLLADFAFMFPELQMIPLKKRGAFPTGPTRPLMPVRLAAASEATVTYAIAAAWSNVATKLPMRRAKR